MKTQYLWIAVFFFMLSCQRDYYQSVPESALGLGILQIDTMKTPLMSTFSFDHSNHLGRETEYCYSNSMLVFRNYNLKIMVYHGLQMIAPGDTLFLNIKGAMNVELVDTNTLSIASTLGEAIVDFSPNNTPVLVSFNYKKRVKESGFNSCLGSKFYKEKNRNFENRIYHECPDTAQKLIYGWYIKNIEQPKCYY